MTNLQLLKLAEPVEEMYMACQSQLLINIAGHFKTGRGLETRDWQIKKLSELGALQEESIEIIAACTGQKAGVIQDTFSKVLNDSLRTTEATLKAAAAKGTIQTSSSSYMASPRVLEVLNDYITQAKTATNLVNTVMLNSTMNRYRWAIEGVVSFEEAERIKLLTSATSEIGLKGQMQLAQDILNEASGSLVLGTQTRQQALVQAVKQLADKGITGFIDIAGHEWSPEAYVNMDIRTTMHNTVVQGQCARSADYGVQTFQISSHSGARPLCAPYQGKVYSWDGSSGVVYDLYGKAYPYESIYNTSYGEPAGIFGINCGHSPLTFVNGFSVPQYEPLSKAELEKNAAEYEKTQKQRALERNVRKNKTEALAQQAAGNTEAFDKAALKVKQSQAQYKAYCKENNLTERGYRTQVVGYNRSVAGKVAAASAERPVYIPKSVGAKSRNYDILLPNGEYSQFTEGTYISSIKVITGKGRLRQIDEVDILVSSYGGKVEEWQKKKGIGHINYKGESRKADVHWYEEPSVGRVKFKVKDWLDES